MITLIMPQAFTTQKITLATVNITLGLYYQGNPEVNLREWSGSVNKVDSFSRLKGYKF